MNSVYFLEYKLLIKCIYVDAGDILIGDSHGNRFHVAVFGNDGNLLGEFECPHVKVIHSFVFLIID